jgi:microsomal dipeptidase-like Zn-dependent dipeptidase
LPPSGAGKLALVFGWEDSGVLEEEHGNDWRDHKLPLTNLRAFYELGVRVAGLQYNDNPRNTSDRVPEGMAKTGRVFGVTAVDGFMTWSRKDAPKSMTGPYPPRAGVARYVDEFDYLKRLVGIDHIGMGPDFISGYEPIVPSNSIEFPPEMSYTQPISIKYIEGFESVDDLGNVRAEMEKRGHAAEEIAKVFGGLSRGVEFIEFHRLLDRQLSSWRRTNRTRATRRQQRRDRTRG